MSALSEIGKIDSNASLDRSPRKNNVERAGGLPPYIRRIANHLHQEKGMEIGHAIATAKNAAVKMCSTGDLNFHGKQSVNPASRAEACAAVADWNVRIAKVRVSKGIFGRKMTDEEFIKHLVSSGATEVIHKGCGCEMETKPKKRSRRRKRPIEKAYDPKQPRDPHSGEWVKVPGPSGPNRIGMFEMSDGSHGIYEDKKRKPSKTYKTKAAAKKHVLRVVDEHTPKRGRGDKVGPNARPSGSTLDKKPARRRSSIKRVADDNGNAQTPEEIDAENRKRIGIKPGADVGLYNKKIVGPSGIEFNGRGEVQEFGSLTKEQKPIYARARKEGRAHSVAMAMASRNSKHLEKRDILSDAEFETLSKSLDIDNGQPVEFLVTGNIEKSEDEKQLVFGWASIAKRKDGTVVVDKQGDVLDNIDQMEKVAYDFVLHSRDGGEMHIRKGVSTLVESFVSTPDKIAAMGIPEGTLPTGWWVGFKVTDSAVWEKVKKGEYKMFSVHGSGTRKRYEGEASE